MTLMLEAGDMVCGYKVIELLGEGGLSQIYKAIAPDGSTVKLKFPSLALIGDPATYERFLREFTIGQKMSHPAIQRTIAMDESSHGIFIVLEYIEGETLRAFFKDHAPLSLDKAKNIFTQLAEAVEYLHKNGVYHRDLKPENIIIGQGDKIHIVDFGIALLEGARRVTWGLGSDAFGTPDYMSPEQIQGKRGDARTDIYALGIILYEMLTGNVPFHGDNSLSVMSQHLTATPPAPRKINPSIPPGIEAVILKSIRRNPDQRYQNVTALLQDLKNYEELDLTQFNVEPERPARGVFTNRQIWILSAVIGVAFLAIAVSIMVIVYLVKHH